MKKFNVHYMETYEGWYDVEAETAEEAKQKLLDLIMDGKVDSPDSCCDSDICAYELD